MSLASNVGLEGASAGPGLFLDAAGALNPLVGSPVVAKYLARAASFAGLPTDETLGVYFCDFETGDSGAAAKPPPGWAQANAGTGTVSMTGAARPSWMRISSGATAGGRGEADMSGSLIKSVRTDPWYVAIKLALATAVTAQTTLLAGPFNLAGTRGIQPGFVGSINPTNLIVQYDGLWVGSGIDLGIAADTADHIVELYGKGSTTLYARSLLNGSELSAVMSSSPADLITGLDTVAKNGTDNAARSMDIDWVLVAFKRG